MDNLNLDHDFFIKVLIGSQACKYHFPDYKEPNDYDYLWNGPTQRVTRDDGQIEEYYNVSTTMPGVRAFYERVLSSGSQIASPELLYTLKLSHVCFTPEHAGKTLSDIRFFQIKGVSYDQELFELLYKDFEQYHSKRRNTTNKKNEDFFKDNVKRKYVHDDLHRAVAYYDAPLFERLKYDQSKAYCSETLCEPQRS